MLVDAVRFFFLPFFSCPQILIFFFFLIVQDLVYDSRMMKLSGVRVASPLFPRSVNRVWTRCPRAVSRASGS
jgi:hypothetical protein